jgi:hypothetical protein
MSDHNANSYDLSQAQQILLVLKQNSGTASKEQPVQINTPIYSTISKSQLLKQNRPGVTKEDINPRQSDEKLEEGPQTFDSWENCIAWCMTHTHAEAAFVVDSQGFVIACRGRIPSQGFEGSGAELICSIEQLERISPESGKLSCIDMDFDKKRLIGIVAASETNDFFVVGLVSPEPIITATKQRIVQQIIRNLPNMD